MVPFILILVLVSTIGAGARADAPTVPVPPKHTLIGDFVLLPRFHSNSLPDDRDVLIFLPPGYDVNSRRRYPVLYMHDGQNLFDGATSFIPGQTWRLGETATELINEGKIEPLIIVGIYNTGLHRIDEYTPTRSEVMGISGGGEANLYGKLIVEELKPYIDRHFRTKTDSADTGIGGSSLGGLVSLYLGLKYPGIFGKVAALSPSAWWDKRYIVSEVSALPAREPLKIWLDIGTAEGLHAGGSSDAVDSVKILNDALVAKGWKPGRDLAFDLVPGATHNEAAWAQRVGPMLEFLFPARPGSR